MGPEIEALEVERAQSKQHTLTKDCWCLPYTEMYSPNDAYREVLQKAFNWWTYEGRHKYLRTPTWVFQARKLLGGGR